MLGSKIRALRGKSVLIIDDEQSMCKLIGSIFSTAGAKVESALTGIDGIELFSQGKHDLVLLDIMIPGEDGLNECSMIRETSTVPLIHLTALSGDHHVVNGLDAGADDYIFKPFEPEVLLARARAVLRSYLLSEHGTGYRFNMLDLDKEKGRRTRVINGF